MLAARAPAPHMLGEHAQPRMRLYCALEGGGAKGVGHVGALRALEEAGFEFCGISGTSAGALVAALKAAGYSADEIIHMNEEKTILDLTPFNHVAEFFPFVQWAIFRLFRKMLSSKIFFWSFGLLIVFGYSCIVYAISLINYTPPFLIGLLITFLFFLIIAFPFVYLGRVFKRGLLNLKTFRGEFGRLLDRKMFNSVSPIPERVRFHHFSTEPYPALKIVATNLSTGELQLFSPKTTPDVPVADAVAASICIPLLFRRRKIDFGRSSHVRESADLEPQYFLDGGLLSNLPAWVFDEERSIDKESILAAVLTSPQGRFSPPDNTLGWIGRAFRTVIFGAAPLNQRNIGRAFFVHLDPDINLLDFDLSSDDCRNAVRQCFWKTNIQVNRYIALEEIPIFVGDIFAEILDMHCENLGISKYDGKIRTAVCSIETSTLELRHHCGFDDAYDKWLTLPLEIFAREDFWPGEGVFLNIQGGALNQILTNSRHNWLRSLLQTNRSWSLLIPVTYEGATSQNERKLAVMIDGSAQLPFEDDQRDISLQKIEEDIKEIFTKRLQE